MNIMHVVKRDGRSEPFNADKIKRVIAKVTDNQSVCTSVLDQLGLYHRNTINVEAIQDMVEQALMYFNLFSEAKRFILYREQHNKTRQEVEDKLAFIKRFKESNNTANATIDDNSNVSSHNIANLNAEIHKKDNQKVNYRILREYLQKMYPDFDYKQMDRDFDSIMYLHDSSSQICLPYCVAISMYPFMQKGIKDLDGLSASPKNIDSFCGLFINLVFAVASQFKGAVATPGVLLCMDYFVRKEWGDDYLDILDENISSPICKRQFTIRRQIHQYFQQICYSLMQPSGSRGSQACFWNLSIFDRTFFDTLYENFRFPDCSEPVWKTFNWLQKEFLHWLNQERLKCILTFPVVSVAMIYRDGKFLDSELFDYVCDEYSQGNSFFTFISDTAESLSSCCRLSSKISKPQFNFTNGQLSEMTGSKNVITLDMNRIVQDACRQCKDLGILFLSRDNFYPILRKHLIGILDRVYKYQTAYNEILLDMKASKLFSVYDAGFIDMNKQYLTIGINGLNQAAEFLGIKCNKNDDYQKLCNVIFTTIKEQNALHKTKTTMFNTEFTPCESAAVKLYNRDKADGYIVPDDTNLYASYIFKPNDKEISVLDKIYLHGSAFCGDNLDGGSAAHINLDTHLSKEQYEKILTYAASVGCKYLTFNVPNSECQSCGYITKVPIRKCPKCGSEHIAYYDRVIGYLTKIDNWSEARQKEQKTRVYTNEEKVAKDVEVC